MYAYPRVKTISKGAQTYSREKEGLGLSFLKFNKEGKDKMYKTWIYKTWIPDQKPFLLWSNRLDQLTLVCTQ